MGDFTIPTHVMYGSSSRDNEDSDRDFGCSDSDEYIPSSELSTSSNEGVSDNESNDYSDSDDDNVLPGPRWRSVSGTNRQNFEFSGNPGTPAVSLLQTENIQPIDVYNIMVTDDICELIVRETNNNANQCITAALHTQSSRLKFWKDTDIAEVKKFFGIILYMGLVKYLNIWQYWSTETFYKNAFVPKLTSRNRFQLLLRFIHFSDNTNSDTNRLYKVERVLDMLQANFVAAKIPGKVVAVDETMVPWRGRLIFRQYILERHTSMA